MSFNQTYQFFTDPDGDPLTLTFANGPAGLTFTDNGGGVGSIVGTAAGSSPWTVDVTADDGQGGVVTQQFTLVCDAEVNPMPPSCPSNQSIDCADMPVTITGFSGATSITASGNTTYTVTPSSDFTAIVIDSVVSGEGENETITITASNVNGSCNTIVTINECVVPAGEVQANGLCVTDGGPPVEPWIWCGFGDTPINNINTGGSATGTTCGITFLAFNNTVDGVGQTHISLTDPLPASVTEFTVSGGGSTGTVDVSGFAGQSSFTVTGQNNAVHSAMSGTLFTITGNC